MREKTRARQKLYNETARRKYIEGLEAKIAELEEKNKQLTSILRKDFSSESRKDVKDR